MWNALSLALFILLYSMHIARLTYKYFQTGTDLSFRCVLRLVYQCSFSRAHLLATALSFPSRNYLTVAVFYHELQYSIISLRPHYTCLISLFRHNSPSAGSLSCFLYYTPAQSPLYRSYIDPCSSLANHLLLVTLKHRSYLYRQPTIRRDDLANL